jgi:hypothetical protein
MLTILACLAGVLLGLTLNVLVLLPATLAGALVYSFLQPGQGFGNVAFLVPAVSLQAGYMIGLTARDMVAQLLARLNIAQSKRV